MGSNYFGETSSSSSSSRKGKKNGSDKPKQPQRGLGVAQLEKIRLHSQLGCSYVPSVPNPYDHHHVPNLNQEDIRVQAAYPTPSSSSFSYSSAAAAPTYGLQGPHGVMMGFQDLDRASVRYADSITRWHPGNAGYGSQQFLEPDMTRPFFEGSITNKKDRHDSMGSNSESSHTQEIDLELRLSL